MPREIVLLHGGAQGSWVWAETIAAIRLEAGDVPVRIVTLDVPGCGEKRGRDTTAMSVPDVLAELACELDSHDVSNALLVGHSQAGTLLPGLAAARPNRVERLAYFACAAPGQGQSLVQMMGRGVQGTDKNTVGWPLDPATTSPADLFHAAFCNDMDAEIARGFATKLGQDNWPEACGNDWTSWHYEDVRHIPATYIIALADGILPVAWQERFAARLNADRVVRLDSGHQGMNTRPFSLAEILIAEARLGS